MASSVGARIVRREVCYSQTRYDLPETKDPVISYYSPSGNTWKVLTLKELITMIPRCDYPPSDLEKHWEGVYSKSYNITLTVAVPHQIVMDLGGKLLYSEAMIGEKESLYVSFIEKSKDIRLNLSLFEAT